MGRDRRSLADQTRRDTVAFDNQRTSAVYHEMVRDDHAKRGSQRRRDSDESREQIVFGPTPWHDWFYGLDQTGWAIRTVHPDGSELRVVLANGEAGTPSWTSDGRILFADANATVDRIQVIDADGSDLQDVARFRISNVDEYPVQQPTR